MRTKRVHKWGAWCGLALLVGACGEDIGLSPEPEPEPNAPEDSRVNHVTNADGTWTTVVDATSSEVWVGVDLDGRTEADAAVDATWDLAIQRFHVRTRGGVNGSGGVKVAVLEGADFGALSAAPASGYAEDQPNEGTTQGTVFEREGGWYNYEVGTHKLTPKPLVYVVRSDQGRYFKVRIANYYDAVGTSGVLSFQWAEVAAP
ncbi:HmuY family protein [Melittangium boletus]|uniref:Lipoprotein n=1 Tax=Melittangium boletus DSM 14713 TaxID=1294270 RepID=A0A250IR06_9BACT|nr:HmuY family protein [Melittangium boletus]ATB33680.1 lipoprotein [Melittangium boletus DSM 14713]